MINQLYLKLIIVLSIGVFSFPLSGFSQDSLFTDFKVDFEDSGEMVVYLKKGDSNEKLDALIDVFLVINNEPAPVQVAGKYWEEKGKVFFKSQYPLEEGRTFLVKVRFKDQHGSIVLKSPKRDKPDVPLAEVQLVYPIDNIVPSNVLFFHIRFTQKMEQDQEAYSLVNLVLNDSVIPQAWRHKAFWLDDGKVLVLMIHPARVKRGIHFLSDEDDLFVTGNKVSVEATKALKDEQGRELKSGSTKEFTVGDRDTIIPKILYDEFELPDKKNPTLKIVFNEKMNYASIIDGVIIYNDLGEAVKGEIKEKDDMSFVFTPENGSWKLGKYSIVFTKVVADLANNRLNRPFEIEDVNDKLLDVDLVWEFEVK